MNNIYYKTLSEIGRFLENKYNTEVILKHVDYEKMEIIKGDNFRASVYRMPSGNYELVDYKIKNK